MMFALLIIIIRLDLGLSVEQAWARTFAQALTAEKQDS
jgi:hypothetical protein